MWRERKAHSKDEGEVTALKRAVLKKTHAEHQLAETCDSLC